MKTIRLKNQSGIAVLEILLVVALVGVIAFAVYLSTQKPASTTTQSTKVSVPKSQSSGEIKSTSDVDTVIKENDADTTAEIDSELSQIDQDLKDL